MTSVPTNYDDAATVSSENPRDAVIVGGARTPFGKFRGALASQSATDLGATAIKGALEKSGVSPSDVQQVIMGHVVQAGQGQNPARQAAIKAGLRWDVPTVTINKVCLSGLAAVTDAARLIRLNEADVVVAGGEESMTNGPYVLPGARGGWGYGDMKAVDSVAFDGLTDAFDGQSMGVSTEKKNSELGIDRTSQDEVAAKSHQRAGQATADGIFSEEIVPVTIPQRKGDPLEVTADEGIRPDSTVESLAALRPAFDKEGTITAGNSSPLSDGAAAVVITSREYAQQHGLNILATIGAPGQVAGPDTSLHSQPSNAIASAVKRQGWDVQDLDFIEINEAFGAVAVQSLKDLDYPLEKTNIHGGAIALGHPIGASGARLALTAALELQRRGSGKAAVSLCGGGGQGEALTLYR